MTTIPTTLPVHTWCRKTALAKVSGVGHTTLGSVVQTTTTKGVTKGIPVGMIGKVVESGKASAWAAKQAVGTTEAFKVVFDVPVSLLADGAYHTGSEWLIVVDGKLLPEEPGVMGSLPAPFATADHAKAALASYKEARGL